MPRAPVRRPRSTRDLPTTGLVAHCPEKVSAELRLLGNVDTVRGKGVEPVLPSKSSILLTPCPRLAPFEPLGIGPVGCGRKRSLALPSLFIHQSPGARSASSLVGVTDRNMGTELSTDVSGAGPIGAAEEMQPQVLVVRKVDMADVWMALNANSRE